VNILRGSRVKKSSKKANRFTSSIEFDAPISRHVVKINMAHMLSLSSTREVSSEVAVACLEFFLHLPERMKLDEETEDVHHFIEQEAIRKIGMEKAGYINLGKSRNDQVATAIRMEAREKMLQLSEALISVQKALRLLSQRFGVLVIPGYTHLQHAQPVTLSFHLQSYFDAFERDFLRVTETYSRLNLSPMGAGALAGTSILVNRRYVASLLGFDGLVKNTMDAVSSRDFVVELISCAEMAMINMSRLAEEIILWSSSEFGFVEVSDEHAATSSIMPQKKNPVVAEMIRAKCGSVLGHLTATCSILKALPNSYNLDLQQVTPHLWGALSETFNSAELMAEMLSKLLFKRSSIASSLEDDKSTATELANHLVRRYKVPFRDAHAIVGELVKESLKNEETFISTVLDQLPAASVKVTGREIKIDKPEAERILDTTKTLSMIKSEGGANPSFVRSRLSENNRSIAKNETWLNSRRSNLRSGERLLQKEIRIAQKEVRN
jgi:argininosuccinate lyase